MKDVQDQYENYPFPDRNPEDERHTIQPCEMEELRRINHYCFAGRQAFGNEFRALVAGGGTGDAVIYLGEQLRDKNVELVYLDISSASMEIAQRRASVRGLDGIRWVQGSIVELDRLDLGEFDYINCAGVLHHLADPDHGLRCLVSALKPDGAMGLMVYGKYGRLDVYALQDLMRIVNQYESRLDAEVENTKRVFRSIPWFNFARRGRADTWAENKITNEPNLVDTYLHKQDRAYDVREVYEFVEGAGVKLLQFTNFKPMTHGFTRLEYDPLFYIKDDTLREKLQRFSQSEREAIAEIINGCIFLHSFYVSRNGEAVAKFDDAENIPYFLNPESEAICRKLVEKGPGAVAAINLRHGIRIPLILDEMACTFLRLIDGKCTMGRILESIASEQLDGESGASRDIILKSVWPLLELLNAVNWIVLRHKSVADPGCPRERPAAWAMAESAAGIFEIGSPQAIRAINLPT